MEIRESRRTTLRARLIVGANVRMYAGPGGNRGEFSAWDPVTGKTVWAVKEMFPAWSGAVVTAGDVVFYGTMEGWFKALDARTGKLLWQFKTGSGIISQPVTYKGPGWQAICRRIVRRRRLGRGHCLRRAEREKDGTAAWAS